MGTLDEDVSAYLDKSRGHFDRGELASAFAQLAKAGGECAGAMAVMAMIGSIGVVGMGIGGLFGIPLLVPIVLACRRLMDDYVKLDAEQRTALVKVAAWMRHNGLSIF